MKKLFLFACIVVTMSTLTNAQSKSREDSVRTEIKQLSKQWTDVIIHPDSASLEKILAPEYTLNGSLPRKVWLNNTLHHIVTESLKVVGEQKITVYGDAAISEATWYWKATFDERKIDTEYRVTDIWKKTNGHWQVSIRMTKATK